MSIYGSSLSRGEQNLRHLAGLEGGSPPVSSDIRYEIDQAHSTPLSNMVSSTFNGLASALDLGTSIAFLNPLFFSTDLRASIIGANPEKVCGACLENTKHLQDLSKWVSDNYEGAGVRVCNFIDSFGIPFQPSKEPSFLATKLSGTWIDTQVRALVSDTLSYLDATEQAGTCSASIVAEKGESFYLCRLTNYAGSVVGTAKDMIQHEYAYHVFTAAAAGLALWTFAENSALPQKSEARAIELLNERYTDIVEAFNEKKDEATIDYLAKVDLKDVSEGIVRNERQMLNELADLDLATLTAEKRAAIIKPIVDLAREHIG